MDNNRNIFKIIILIIGLLVGIISAFAESQDTVKQIQPVQFSFIYPLSTNGIRSREYVNHFSINLLGGITRGTSGFEAGGLFNVDLGHVRGAQFAGIGNYVKGSFSGGQFGGLLNINEQNTDGAQFGGLVNLNIGTTRGALFAGITNIMIRKTSGAQFAGISNIVINDTKSTHIAGINNLVIGNSRGFQLAGIANLSIQDHHGTQIAGILNYTRRLNGFQLGLLNISDTVDKGVPLGFISFVRHGYFAVEFEFNELFYTNVNLKTGVPHLYNIISIGYRPDNQQQNWGLTYGLGTYKSFNEKLSLNFDATATHINEGESWTKTLNMVNRLKLNLGFQVANNIELFGGASLNIAISKITNDEGIITGSSLVPSYTFYNETFRKTNVKMYPGFNAGIRIK